MVKCCGEGGNDRGVDGTWWETCWISVWYHTSHTLFNIWLCWLQLANSLPADPAGDRASLNLWSCSLSLATLTRTPGAQKRDSPTGKRMPKECHSAWPFVSHTKRTGCTSELEVSIPLTPLHSQLIWFHKTRLCYTSLLFFLLRGEAEKGKKNLE